MNRILMLDNAGWGRARAKSLILTKENDIFKINAGFSGVNALLRTFTNCYLFVTH
jgi:hypothetical protein